MCAAWLGAGGEESVNPAFLGRSQLLAVRRRMPSCAAGLGEVSPGKELGWDEEGSGDQLLWPSGWEGDSSHLHAALDVLSSACP